MGIIGIIPARYASTRFPAKPLVEIEGKSMIQRVYEQAKKSKYLSKVVVATDHPLIYEHVQTFGEACMTREDHASGTDRCFEALKKQQERFDYVVNIQGDEPFIHPAQIDLLADTLDGITEIGTVVKRLTDEEQLFNPNIVKVVLNKKSDALYFSRSPIPFMRNHAQDQWLQHNTFYKHIGMYAYRTDILEELTTLPLSSLEKAESLEQLRWLENGFRIRTVTTETETIGIDTPQDLERAISYLRSQENL
jgi:3-deoxy-manno-octulosonate cytidylyltransferase (CMP-KDO synthetase)